MHKPPWQQRLYRKRDAIEKTAQVYFRLVEIEAARFFELSLKPPLCSFSGLRKLATGGRSIGAFKNLVVLPCFAKPARTVPARPGQS